MPSRPGRGAHQHDAVADPRGGRANHLVGTGEPDAHRVDEAVLLVRRLEVDLAANGRHADRVAVVADPGDDLLEQIPRALRVELAEAQRVEDRDRPRAEGEDVAEDAADAGRGALEGLDRARVIVRLDLEGDRPAVADRHGAGVLARTHQHPRALGREPAQQLLRVLVGAVLGPQQAEHRQLDAVGLAPELVDDQLELGVGEAELAVLGKCCDRLAQVIRQSRRSSCRHVRRARALSTERSTATSRPSACCDRRMGGPTRTLLAAPALAAIAALIALAAARCAARRRRRRRSCPARPRRPTRRRGDESELLERDPDLQAPGQARPGRDVDLARPVRPDPGRRPPAGQRRGPGLDHLRRPGSALRRHALRDQPEGDGANRPLVDAGHERRRLPAANRQPHRGLQAAAPEPKPPLHDRPSERRDDDLRPLGTAVRA